ncbi:MAG: Mur ligase family protein [Candidatus Levybacteria bacterium]|nr:Mur ligase family protein [Candidatus Levybacteria bacterium]
MRNAFIVLFCKILSSLTQKLNLGNGSTWPGHIAIRINPHIINQLLKNSRTKILFIVGTNGKTTTTSLLSHILTADGKKIIHNSSGANLLNGIASILLQNSTFFGKIDADVALFEIDENIFPLITKSLRPDAVVALNLFRDQLDRYGEINTIAEKWRKAIASLPQSTKLYLNADDPQIAYLGRKAHQEVFYFGLEEKSDARLDHAADSTYCPACGNKLLFSTVYYAHLGIWKCPNGDFSRPKPNLYSSDYYPLSGLYNKYNTIAAMLVAKSLGLTNEDVSKSLRTFSPAFGRQEKITYHHKHVEIILAKNPAGFNQTLQTINELKAKNILFVLNDRIADGKDVSWIWDVDFEKLQKDKKTITISGDRVYDMALRCKYAGLESKSKNNLEEAISYALSQMEKNETLFIIPTYTAMLEVRKIITGKKIL